jgi:hypothetical protein
MTFTTDVSGNFLTIGQTNSGDFAQSRVRFLRRSGGYLQANSATLRAIVQRT